MNFTKPPLSKHHRARLLAWTLAMLMWMVAALFGAVAYSERLERQRGPRMSLEWLTRRVKLLIICRAMDLTRKRWRISRSRAHAGRAIVARGVLRALIGARVHRMLKRRDLGDRIGVLVDALCRIDDYAALVAKRLKRGLTRRWLYLFALPPAPDARAVSLAAASAFIADTS